MSNTTTNALREKQNLRLIIRNTLTMAYRALLRIRRTPEKLVDVFLLPVVFTLLFTYMFGGAISGDVQDYLPHVIPGMLVQAVLVTSVMTGVQMREDMDTGVFDRFKSLPIARIAPLAGALMTDTLRYAIASGLTLTISYFMGYRPEGGIGYVLLAALLVIGCAWAISWIFALIGVIARSASSVQGMSMIVFPLTFMSNAFVPTETMSDTLQWFVSINPITYLVTAIRDLMNAGTIGWDFTITVIAAIVIVLIFAPLTVRAYMKRV